MRIVKSLFIAVICLLALTGCKTKVTIQKEYVYPTLPEFTIEAPTNPVLETIPENATSADAIKILSANIVKLISANNQHTIYEAAFIEFYNNVRNDLTQSQENTLR